MRFLHEGHGNYGTELTTPNVSDFLQFVNDIEPSCTYYQRSEIDQSSLRKFKAIGHYTEMEDDVPVFDEDVEWCADYVLIQNMEGAQGKAGVLIYAIENGEPVYKTEFYDYGNNSLNVNDVSVRFDLEITLEEWPDPEPTPDVNPAMKLPVNDLNKLLYLVECKEAGAEPEENLEYYPDFKESLAKIAFGREAMADIPLHQYPDINESLYEYFIKETE